MKKVPAKYLDRIDVITMGGKNHILPEEVSRVSNLAYKTDLVPYIFADPSLRKNASDAKNCLLNRSIEVCTKLFGKDVKAFEILNSTYCNTFMCHGNEDYLHHNKTIEILFDYIQTPPTAPAI